MTEGPADESGRGPDETGSASQGPPSRARPFVLAALLVGAALATYTLVAAAAGAWALANDGSDTAGLARLVLLPALAAVGLVAGGAAVALLAGAAVQSRALLRGGGSRLPLLMWALPAAGAAALPLRALL